MSLRSRCGTNSTSISVTFTPSSMISFTDPTPAALSRCPLATVMSIGSVNSRKSSKSTWSPDMCELAPLSKIQTTLSVTNVLREAKHRVWQGFWRALLLEVAQNTSKQSESSGEMGIIDRLTALEQAIVASGIHRIRAHWRREEDQYTTKLRQVLRLALEGVDDYWDDATGTRDGHLDLKTCFGKMYVVPYPFHCVVVYDDCTDKTILRDDIDDKSKESKLAKHLFLNFTPGIMAKRELRPSYGR
ncbi:unnamed protein product [Phytophthora lilii]|uniref:Unnamed protein product n=1 Tax=Phytophthora lilii TaxID=2077276 RepID=A0A9W6U6V1_9STRA|nr:unnamed protein product [Phytophthora lilii]